MGDDLEGLCHISELSDERVERPEQVVSIDQEMDFKILRIENDVQKIGLSARAVGKEDEPEIDTKVYSTEAKGGMASLAELANLKFGRETEEEVKETPKEDKKAKIEEAKTETTETTVEAETVTEVAEETEVVEEKVEVETESETTEEETTSETPEEVVAEVETEVAEEATSEETETEK